MNETDFRILELLRKNSRESFVNMAKKVGLSEGAVRNRVKELCDSGVIESFTVRTHSPDLLKVIVEVRTSPDYATYKIADQICSVGGMEGVYELTGNLDVLVMVSANSHLVVDDIVEKIRKIKGVVSTSTHLVLKEH